MVLSLSSLNSAQAAISTNKKHINIPFSRSLLEQLDAVLPASPTRVQTTAPAAENVQRQPAITDLALLIRGVNVSPPPIMHTLMIDSQVLLDCNRPLLDSLRLRMRSITPHLANGELLRPFRKHFGHPVSALTLFPLHATAIAPFCSAPTC